MNRSSATDDPGLERRSREAEGSERRRIAATVRRARARLVSGGIGGGKGGSIRAGDLWGGLAAMLVALPSSIAYGVLVYTALGPEYAAQGALAGILGAAALGIISPIIGRTGGLISAPSAPAAAVLSALVGVYLSRLEGGTFDPALIPLLILLTMLLSSGLQIVYGLIGGGRLIKFIPYPVVSGYLSGVGVLIAIGQLPRLFGLPPGTNIFEGLIIPDLWKWEGLAVGLVTMTIMGAAPRLTDKVPGPVLALLGGWIAYLVIGLFSPGLFELNGNPLVIGPIGSSGTFVEGLGERITSIFTLDIPSVRMIVIPAVTLSVVLSIDTLKTCVILDVLTRRRHNSDRELIGQGIGNLVSSLIGGMPGSGTSGPTLVNMTSGGSTPWSGVFAGTFVLLAFLLLGGLIAWVPIGVLAGILLVIAWRMFDRSMFRMLRYPMGRLDFAVTAMVIVTAATVDLIAASAVGIGLAILLFLRDQIQSPVIRRKSDLCRVSSKTRRIPTERAALDRLGDLGIVCELQGNLFFGTVDQLVSQLEPELRGARYILLDMRRVLSMDSTAMRLFEQMHAQLAEHGGRLLLSRIPSDLLDRPYFHHHLTRLEGADGKEDIIISEKAGDALEWMEERLLESAGLSREKDDRLLEPTDFELFNGLDRDTLDRLSASLRELSVKPGEKVCGRGDEGDELFLIRRGSVRILLPLNANKSHHIATIGTGDFFGELSFLDRTVRSADVVATVRTDLYILSRSLFEEQIESDGGESSGTRVMARLALAISERLRRTNVELQAIEEH